MELASKDSCTGCGNCRLVCKKKAVMLQTKQFGNLVLLVGLRKQFIDGV